MAKKSSARPVPKPPQAPPEKDLRPDRVRLARTRAGFTQFELGKRTGIAPSTLSSIEAGRKTVTAPLLIRLCLALECSADYLLGLSGEVSR